MAEDKKTIIIYSDWQSIFQQLEDDEAGKLIKHFFSYVNDENPNLEDRLLRMAFEPMKLQLKRDLSKWEETKKKRSEAGKIGGINSGKTRAKEAKEANEANASNVKQSEANEAVNVNVNDSVIDNVNVIQKDISTPPKGVAIDFDKFIKTFNSFANRQFTVTDKVKGALKARLKKYTREQVVKAIASAHLDQYHIESNFKHLTPEFILREDKLEKYINANNSKPKTPASTGEIKIDHSNRPIV